MGIPFIIPWAHAAHCLTNNEGVVYGQGWCIGSWVGVIDSFSLGLNHLDAWLRLAKSPTTKQTVTSVQPHLIQQHIPPSRCRLEEEQTSHPLVHWLPQSHATKSLGTSAQQTLSCGIMKALSSHIDSSLLTVRHHHHSKSSNNHNIFQRYSSDSP